MNSNQVAAFENFRNSLSNVLILTFDELYQRVKDLVSILSKDEVSAEPVVDDEIQDDVIDELPF